MIRRPPRSTRTDTLFPYTTLFRSVGASRLFLLTDVAGVLDKQKNLLTDLTPPDIAVLRSDGTISGGMIPKLETCVTAVAAGVDAAVILDGRVPHAMLLAIFTRQGAGTPARANGCTPDAGGCRPARKPLGDRRSRASAKGA